MKKTNQQINGTSFHGVTIEATPLQLIALADYFKAEYYEDNTGEDKCNYDFVFETDNGDIFTIYDWKQYESLVGTEIYEFHIGSYDTAICLDAKTEIKEYLDNLSIFGNLIDQPLKK